MTIALTVLTVLFAVLVIALVWLERRYVELQADYEELLEKQLVLKAEVDRLIAEWQVPA